MNMKLRFRASQEHANSERGCTSDLKHAQLTTPLMLRMTLQVLQPVATCRWCPQGRSSHGQGGGGEVNYEVSCDWRFQPPKYIAKARGTSARRSSFRMLSWHGCQWTSKIPSCSGRHSSGTLLMEIHPIHGPLCLPTRNQSRLVGSYNGGNLKLLNETCITRETMGNPWFWVPQFEETPVLYGFVMKTRSSALTVSCTSIYQPVWIILLS